MTRTENRVSGAFDAASEISLNAENKTTKDEIPERRSSLIFDVNPRPRAAGMIRRRPVRF